MVLADESIRIQKNVQHIGEIKAAFLVTRIAFIFILFKFHGSMVVHWPTYVNARWGKGRQYNGRGGKFNFTTVCINTVFIIFIIEAIER